MRYTDGTDGIVVLPTEVLIKKRDRIFHPLYMVSKELMNK